MADSVHRTVIILLLPISTSLEVIQRDEHAEKLEQVALIPVMLPCDVHLCTLEK